MPNAKFNLVQDNGDSQITLYHDGETHLADSSHPRWDDIFRLVVVDDDPESALELFDVTRLLRRLVVSERVTVTYNAVLFDNDPVHDALADHIVRLVNEGEDVTAWVKLLENIKQNPNPDSVKQLYRHLDSYNYTVTQDGMILAYKGVRTTKGYAGVPEEGVYYSTVSGHAIVNGEDINGYVPQRIGDIVEMPRSEVTFDPNVTCSSGLHVADWGYAQTMGNTVLAVLVNPRDVVSVPTDYKDAKVRVCRYKVLEVRTEPYAGAVRKTEVSVSIKPEPKAEPKPKKGVKAKLDKLRSRKANSDTDDTSDSETTQETDVATATAPVRYRYPSPAKFEEIASAAKRQKKGLRRFIEARTNWTLIDGRGDGSDRKDWQV